MLCWIASERANHNYNNLQSYLTQPVISNWLQWS